MSDQTVDSRTSALLQALLRGGGSGSAAGTVAGSTTTRATGNPLDAFTRGAQTVGFPGQLTQNRTATSGHTTRETAVQPGNGDMNDMLTQEFGPEATKLLSLLSGTGAGLFAGQPGGQFSATQTYNSTGDGDGGSGLGSVGTGTGGGSAGGLASLLGQGGGGLGGLLGGNGGGGGLGGLLGGNGGGGGLGALGEIVETIIEDLLGGNGGGGDYNISSGSTGGGAAAASAATDPNAEPELMLNSGTGGQDQGNYVSLSGSTLWGDGTVRTQSGNSQESLSNEVQQGGAGDCYFLSGLASLAASNPDAVKGMIRQDPDGKPGDYQVRFYAKDQNGQMQPEWVSVDDKLPVGSDGKTLYDHVPLDGQGQPCIGMALIEKAYAKFNDEHQITQGEGVQAGNGYDGIGEGGTGAEAMEALTGQTAQIYGGGGDGSYGSGVNGGGGSNGGGGDGGDGSGDLASSMTQQQLLALLQPANNHQPITAGTVSSGGVNDANGIPRLPGGLIPGHQYSVLGTYTDQNGQTMVTLRNPWGGDAQNQPGADSQGVFSISLDQFSKDFGTVVSTGGGGQSSTSSGTQQFTGNSLQTFSLRNLQNPV